MVRAVADRARSKSTFHAISLNYRITYPYFYAIFISHFRFMDIINFLKNELVIATCLVYCLISVSTRYNLEITFNLIRATTYFM